MILLVLSTACALLGAGAVAAALDLPRPVDVANAWVVLLCSQLVALVLVIGGALAQLNTTALTVGSAAVAVAEVAVVRRWRRDQARRSLAGLRSSTARAVRAIPRSPAAMVLGALVVLQYTWRAAQVLWLPKVGYDGLGYHLISPDTWIQSGRIVHTPQVIFADVYPQDLEVITAWIGTFLGSVRLSALSQVPFLAMGALSVAGIARGLGARRRAAGVAALALLAIPAVFLPTGTDYVDVPATAAVLAALHFGLRFTERDSKAPVALLFLTGCSLGLAAGIKSANLVAVALVVLILVVLGLHRIKAVSKPAAAAALALPVVALAAYWYVRTWITYSNPFYPVNLLGFEGTGSIEDVLIGANKPSELAGGTVTNAVRSWLNDLRPHEYLYDQRLGGFGLQWVALLLPVFVVAIVIGVRRRQRAVWVLALFGALVTFASPASWWARFTLVLPAIALALFAWFVSTVGPIALRKGLTAGLVAMTALSMWWATSPTYILVADQGTTHPAPIGEAIDLMRTPERHDEISPWFSFFPLDMIPADATIARPESSWQPYTHPFVGDDLQRRLVHIDDPADADALAASMDAAGARYVLVSLREPIADVVRSDPARFRRVPGADLFEEWLVERGDFEVCGDVSLTLAAETMPTDGSGGSSTFAGRLTDGCGRPQADASVELWQGDPGRPLWEADRRTTVVRTDGDGVFRAAATVGPGDNRFFARTVGEGERPAAASPVVIVPVGAPAAEPVAASAADPSLEPVGDPAAAPPAAGVAEPAG